MFKKHIITATVMALLSTPVLAKTYEDGYLKGLEAYAKETGDPSFKTYADEVKAVEKAQGYIGTELPLPPFVEVMPNVYIMTGALMWATKENFGLNNNISFVIFEDGVFVFNAAPNPVVAYSAHKMIKRITSKPVKWIAIENNQGHANLGASYWWDVGVRNFYSQAYAIEDYNKSYERSVERGFERGDELLYGMTRNISDKYTSFKDKLDINVGGGEVVQLRYFGEAHTRGSTAAFVPSKKLLFTGDLGYVERMIAVFPYTNTQDWIDAFARMQAFAGDDAMTIPGHGDPAPISRVRTDTYDYLVYMRDEALKLIKQGKGIEAAEEIDQTQFKDRPVYAQTYVGNAKKIMNDILRNLEKKAKKS